MESPLRITVQMTLICNASFLHTENINGYMSRRQPHYGPRGVYRAPDKTKADRFGAEAGGDITSTRGFSNRIDHPLPLHFNLLLQPIAPPLSWLPENGFSGHGALSSAASQNRKRHLLHPFRFCDIGAVAETTPKTRGPT
jgi:hypothetical protein